jgi:hypothetical protein
MAEVRRRRGVRACSIVVACVLAACSGGDDDGEVASSTVPPSEQAAPTSPVSTDASTPGAAETSSTVAPPPSPGSPPRNPYLAESGTPIGHIDSAQSGATPIPGPTGPGRSYTPADLSYTHLGPGHFGLAVSAPYPDGSRVIWTNGGDRITKLDYDTLAVLDELPLPGRQLMTADAADAAIDRLDALEGPELATASLEYAAQYLAGLSGVYYVLDRDNTLFVAGAESIIAYGDGFADRGAPITVSGEWPKPPEVGGGFVGINMTFDGRLVTVTDEGWLVVVARDFSSYDAIALPGAEAAPQHNVDIVASGHRLGAGSWVRNSVAVDDRSIYVASVDHMHRVVWDGSELSTDPVDGAWSEPYRNGTGLGTGATPALMGFDDDRFVVITDGDQLMNVVLFWRDEIPGDWAQLPGAPSRRIAGQIPADMGDASRQAIQSEQAVVVGGFGALVVNNEPASVPDGFPAAGARTLVAYSGNDPAYAPHGMQKFEWDPERREFREAWVNTDASSANAVPIVSTGSNLVYTVGSRDRQWTLEAIDWSTGETAFTDVTGSARYNSLFSGIQIDEDGRIIHTTAFGILRYPSP